MEPDSPTTSTTSESNYIQRSLIQLGLAGVIAPLLCSRCWRTAAAIAVVAMIDLAFLVPLWCGGELTNAPPDLRILSANVKTANSDYGALLQLVADEDPDVIAILEVNHDWATALSKLHESYPHRIEAPRSDNFGIALYSRIPCAFLEVIQFSTVGVP